jgi:Ni/Co efflux regulator RcnB
MKRLLPLIILALLAPSAAEAQRGDRGERGGGREARAERRWSEQGPPRAHSRDWRAPGPDRRAEPRFDGRFNVARRDRDRQGKPDKPIPPGQGRRHRDGRPLPPGQAKRLDGRFDHGPPRRGGYARGHVLPPEFRGARMNDYARYRLRRPPPGYSYYLRGRSAYLISDRSGMIFEVVPIGG